MALLFEIETKGLRDMEGKFAKAGSRWDSAAEYGLREFGGRAAPITRMYAPGTRLPTAITYKLTRSQKTIMRLQVVAQDYPEDILKYIVHGTRPHAIVARRARALRFYWAKAGGVVYFKRVWHPGTEPNKFIQRALDDMTRSGFIDDIGRRTGEQIIRALA